MRLEDGGERAPILNGVSHKLLLFFGRFSFPFLFLCCSYFLFSQIRFPLLSRDFLVDIVKQDKEWYQGLPTDDYKAMKAELDARVQECVPTRPGLPTITFFSYVWEVPKVSKFVKNVWTISPTFYVDGYWFYLQCARRPLHQKNEQKESNEQKTEKRLLPETDDAFCLYLAVDLLASGLATERDFFIQTESEFRIFNHVLKRPEPMFTPSKDCFYKGQTNLGYDDVFKEPWSKISLPSFPYKSPLDSMTIELKIRLHDH